MLKRRRRRGRLRRGNRGLGLGGNMLTILMLQELLVELMTLELEEEIRFTQKEWLMMMMAMMRMKML